MSLPFLACSLYGMRSSLARALQHLAISLTTSVTLALGDLFNISARFYKKDKSKIKLKFTRVFNGKMKKSKLTSFWNKI